MNKKQREFSSGSCCCASRLIIYTLSGIPVQERTLVRCAQRKQPPFSVVASCGKPITCASPAAQRTVVGKQCTVPTLSADDCAIRPEGSMQRALQELKVRNVAQVLHISKGSRQRAQVRPRPGRLTEERLGVRPAQRGRHACCNPLGAQRRRPVQARIRSPNGGTGGTLCHLCRRSGRAPASLCRGTANGDAPPCGRWHLQQELH